MYTDKHSLSLATRQNFPMEIYRFVRNRDKTCVEMNVSTIEMKLTHLIKCVMTTSSTGVKCTANYW